VTLFAWHVTANYDRTNACQRKISTVVFARYRRAWRGGNAYHLPSRTAPSGQAVIRQDASTRPKATVCHLSRDVLVEIFFTSSATSKNIVIVLCKPEPVDFERGCVKPKTSRRVAAISVLPRRWLLIAFCWCSNWDNGEKLSTLLFSAVTSNTPWRRRSR